MLQQQQLQILQQQQQQRVRPARPSTATDGMAMGARESAADYVGRLRQAEAAATLERERGLGE